MASTPKKQVCAWLSRHPPSAAQYRSLAAYRIVQFARRWQSARQAWGVVCEVCGGEPALAVVVMPEDMLCQFILIAHSASRTQIIKPKMAYFDQEHWSGKWQRVYVYPKLGFQSWEPEIRKGK
jgi:hypothetical protein